MIDAHFHVFNGNPVELKNLIEQSPYKNQYMVYNSVHIDSCEFKRHTSFFEKVFCIPFFLKEITVSEANESLYNSLSHIQNGYAIPLIDSADLQFNSFSTTRFIGAKEHFLIHNAFDASSRHKAYTYLEKHNKFLLIHCSDGVRLEYIRFLRSTYPRLKILIAHLGATRRDSRKTIELIDYFANDEFVFYDISTITDSIILKHAFTKMNYERICFGTDKPFISMGVETSVTFITDFLVDENQQHKIFTENALKLISS